MLPQWDQSTSMLPSTTLGGRSSTYGVHNYSHKNFERNSRYDSSHYATPQVSFPSLNTFKPVNRNGRNGQSPLSPPDLNKFLQSSLNLATRPHYLEGLSHSVTATNPILKRQVSEEKMMQTMKIYNESLSQYKKFNITNNSSNQERYYHKLQNSNRRKIDSMLDKILIDDVEQNMFNLEEPTSHPSYDLLQQ